MAMEQSSETRTTLASRKRPSMVARQVVTLGTAFALVGFWVALVSYV